MIATPQFPPHSKRRALGIAVMAMATFREAHAQISALPPLASELAASQTHDDPQLALHRRITAVETSMPPADNHARQQQIDALMDLALRLEGAGRRGEAIHELEHARQLAADHDPHARFMIELAMAHASDDPAGAALHCAAANPQLVPDVEIRRHLLGDRELLAEQKELFCGDAASARAEIAYRMTQHPHRGAPHQVLSEWELATGDWAEAQREFQLWRNSPDILAATTGH